MGVEIYLINKQEAIDLIKRQLNYWNSYEEEKLLNGLVEEMESIEPIIIIKCKDGGA